MFVYAINIASCYNSTVFEKVLPQISKLNEELLPSRTDVLSRLCYTLTVRRRLLNRRPKRRKRYSKPQSVPERNLFRFPTQYCWQRTTAATAAAGGTSSTSTSTAQQQQQQSESDSSSTGGRALLGPGC